MMFYETSIILTCSPQTRIDKKITCKEWHCKSVNQGQYKVKAPSSSPLPKNCEKIPQFSEKNAKRVRWINYHQKENVTIFCFLPCCLKRKGCAASILLQNLVSSTLFCTVDLRYFPNSMGLPRFKFGKINKFSQFRLIQVEFTGCAAWAFDHVDSQGLSLFSACYSFC